MAASFRRSEDVERDDLDMTPMVDVTFLLLIFFMVTAAFSLQKSLEVPTPDQQENATESRTLEEIEASWMVRAGARRRGFAVVTRREEQ